MGHEMQNMLMQDVLMFFDRQPAAYPLYAALQAELLARWPETRIRVQKTQISFYHQHLYACVSFLRLRRKAELPEPYVVLTLGLPAPVDAPRVAAQTEPHPGRWTAHIVLHQLSDLDDELFGWVDQAHAFAQRKGQQTGGEIK